MSRHENLGFQCHEIIERTPHLDGVSVREVESPNNGIQGNIPTCQFTCVAADVDDPWMTAARKDNKPLA